MLFSLGQSSDCFAILRNLLETHTYFSARRPADAKESQSSVKQYRHSMIESLIASPAESTQKRVIFAGRRPADAKELNLGTGLMRNLLRSK